MHAAPGPFVRCVAAGLLLAGLFLAPAAGHAQGSCTPAPTALCLGGDRFRAEVAWTVPGLGSGPGQAVPLTADTGSFWFFSGSNLELVVKVLDGGPVNGHFWVFYGGLSDIEYTLTVTDTQTGLQKTYQNPQGRLASAADVAAFSAEPPPPGAAARKAAEKTAAKVAAPTGAPLPAGSEFPVNVSTAGDQNEAAVAVAADGGFVVVWTSGTVALAAGNSTDVYGRVFDAAGNPRTGEIRLNQAFTGNQMEPRVAVNAAGEILAVWLDSGKGVEARLFGADGSPLTPEGTLSPGAGLEAVPDVAADPDGGFLVAWNLTTLAAPAMDNQIHVERFGADGLPVGSPVSFQSSHGPQNEVQNARVVASPRGGFLVAWSETSVAVDVAQSQIWAQRLDASGHPLGGQIAVSDPGETASEFSLVTPLFYADGGFSILWTSSPTFIGSGFDGLYAHRYAADGSPAGDVVPFLSGTGVGDSTAAALPLPSGDTWVLWHAAGTPAQPDSGVFAGVFDPSWTLLGDVSEVNSHHGGTQVDPAVAMSPGGIVAVWASGAESVVVDPPVDPAAGPQDGSGFGVYGQRFTAADCALSSDQLCLGGRFRVAVQFTDPRSGLAGAGQGVPLTGDTGAFWFFDAANLELMLKVLDGRAVNGHFWFYSGALSDVAYTITVTDTATGLIKTYFNQAHEFLSRADTSAF
jgi:hypothetical protein